MISTLGSMKRGIRNVLRNPVRLVLVVVLLGASLTFAAAMVALNSSSQNRLAQVQREVGTSITVSPPRNGFTVAGTLSQKQVAKALAIPGIVGSTQVVSQSYSGTNIRGTRTVASQFQQSFFQRFRRPPTGGGGPGSGGFPGRRPGSGFGFRKKIFNVAKGNTISPIVTGLTGAAKGVILTGGGTVQIVAGRDLTASDAHVHNALVSQALAKANKFHLGSTFKLNKKKMTIVGEYTTGSSQSDNSLVVPIALAKGIFNLHGITSLTIYAQDASHVNPLAKALKSTLNPSYAAVTTNSSVYKNVYAIINSTAKNIQTALIASLITAALVIMFAVFIIVRERTREIGVLKAIGASSLNIVTQFTAEVLGLTVSAAVVAGVLLAVFGEQIAHRFNVSTATIGGGGPGGGFAGTFARTGFSPPLATSNLAAGLNASTLVTLLAAAVGLAVVASWVPTWYVSRVRPARVLSRA